MRRGGRFTGLREGGFTFVEMLITLTFLSIALLALTSQFPLGLKVSREAEDITVQTNLAQELMEEIRGMLYWADPAMPPGTPLGPDGEPDRWSYNDVDDYDGLFEVPPYDLQGNPMDGSGGHPDFTRYQRSVTVSYADPTTFESFPGQTDFKRIEVTVTSLISNDPNVAPLSVSLTTIVARTP